MRGSGPTRREMAEAILRDRACQATFQALSGFAFVDGGDLHSLAIDQNGDAWGWGLNDYGQVGTGTNVTPILVPEAIQMP